MSQIHVVDTDAYPEVEGWDVQEHRRYGKVVLDRRSISLRYRTKAQKEFNKWKLEHHPLSINYALSNDAVLTEMRTVQVLNENVMLYLAQNQELIEQLLPGMTKGQKNGCTIYFLGTQFKVGSEIYVPSLVYSYGQWSDSSERIDEGHEGAFEGGMFAVKL